MEHVLDLLITLRHLGLPIRSIICVFGDNKNALENSMKPHGKMHKRHEALSFHRAREVITSNIVNCLFINGKFNLDYVLTKHWAHHDI